MTRYDVLTIEKMTLRRGDVLIFWCKGEASSELFEGLDMPPGVTGYVINSDVVDRIEHIPCDEAKSLLRNIIRTETSDGEVVQ
jgi:hypothetical protein